MEPYGFVNDLQHSLGGQLQVILGALALLLVGWLIALFAGAGVRKLLAALGANQRLNTSADQSYDFERLGARVVFWFVLVIALVASLNLLNLQVVSAPFANMINEVLTFLPRIFAALILGLVAWVLAVTVRLGLTRVLAMTSLDERLSAEAGATALSSNIGQIAYWLVFLLFLPMILAALGLNGLLLPIQSMITDILVFIPNVFAAAVIAVVGYMIAKIVRGIVTNVVSGLNLQSLAQRGGLSEQTNLPSVAGTIVFLLILIPTLIAALDALQIEAISQPATQMLYQITEALPNIIAAVLILGLTWVVSRFVASVIEGLLNSTGVNSLPAKMGMPDALGQKSVAQMVGMLLVFFAMLFAVVEAANRLDMVGVSGLIAMFIAFGADILLGTVILAIGLWLAKTVGDTVQRSRDSAWLGTLVRVLIMGLVIAMGLRAMGIADSIVNMAFGLTLGAVAIAFALAFGLGGREAADRLLTKWLDQADAETKQPTSVPNASITDDRTPL